MRCDRPLVPGMGRKTRALTALSQASVRGRRVEVAMPALPTALSAGVLYHATVAETVCLYMQRHHRAKANHPQRGVALDFVSFIHNFVGSDTQQWHTDSDYEDGVKVQVPLVGVTRAMGPVEMVSEVMSASDTHTIVRGTVSQGTAIFYRYSLEHRGRRNMAWPNRTVLDFSFMLRRNVEYA